MAALTLPSQDYLRQCFDYDPHSGDLVWRQRPLEHFKLRRVALAWNTQNAGRLINCRDRFGYRVCSVDKKIRRAHRLIWMLVHNVEPDEVDHINGDPADNRLLNLRSCTHRENLSNTKRRSDNVSGVKGAYWHSANAKWVVNVLGKYVGGYSSLDDAKEAYRAAAEEVFGEFARLQ